MASSISTASSATYPFPYPYPSPCPEEEINVAEFVPFKLRFGNYPAWRMLMLGLIERHSLLGFINGEVVAPPKMITLVPPRVLLTRANSSSSTDVDGTKEMEMENQDYQAWKRSDQLLQKWIRGTITEKFAPKVTNLETAKDMWTALEKEFHFDNSTRQNVEKKDVRRYKPLYKAVIVGDWQRAKTFLEEEPNAVRAIITQASETALMIAVKSAKRNHFVKNLVECMSAEDVALTDDTGLTALHYAAAAGNKLAAELLVNKNPGLPDTHDNENCLPLQIAAACGRRSMVLYLLNVTTTNIEPQLVKYMIHNGLYDIALARIQRYPQSVYIDVDVDSSPLQLLATDCLAFRSGTSLNWWQTLIYSYVPIHLEDYRSGGNSENSLGSFVPVKQEWHVQLWKVSEMLVPQIKHIRNKKCIHDQALQLVKKCCMELEKLDYSRALEIIQPSLIKAASLGIHEIVEEIFTVFPDAVYYKNEKGQNVFVVAIVNRRKNVFNLIYQFSKELRHTFISSEDATAKHGLHLIANFENEQKFNITAEAAGAALQMQCELQWFQEVEKLSKDYDKEYRNTEKELAARMATMVFTKTHGELVKEGEKWMKDTANSCTLVALLVVTVVFAAAITVPGGNQEFNGLPVLLKHKAFVNFIIWDALALFSSISSALIFMSILTSRYAQEDFLYTLPNRLIIGLGTLFVSIISMMIAFAITLYLVFGHSKAWILIPIMGFSSIPITLFASLQFPLLWDMIKSTYGHGIFGKQNDRILF